MAKLDRSFYLHPDVREVARRLIGMVIVTRIDGMRTSGMITETEAYAGVDDSASHAYKGRRTARNESMYAIGGTAYVYISYGIHHLFNIVTNQENIPHAVLLRSIEPLEGLNHMMLRRNKREVTPALTTGPGSAALALGISKLHDGCDLTGTVIWIEDRGLMTPYRRIVSTPRIGIDNSGKDRYKPYRYYLGDSPWVSRTR